VGVNKEKKKNLRSGYTTGACSAAVAKAAVLLFLQRQVNKQIEIPFPDGSRHSFQLIHPKTNKDSASISTIKDAGDDPDVTNGAQITASVRWLSKQPENSVPIKEFFIQAGVGVGIVTKPGLAVAPGEPAINPVPRQMIAQAVSEALVEAQLTPPAGKKLCITISVPKGKELAQKTLNERLGILDGISILGTTGIVRPVSADAWKATISTSMDVAKEAGLKDIVISTGRTSEKGVQSLLKLPEEAYAMVGDYLRFSLLEAAKKGFATIHYGGMWAKIMKAALEIPQTHVRNGALEIKQGIELLERLGAEKSLCAELEYCNTAREILLILEQQQRADLIEAICLKAQQYAENITKLPVKIYLVNHKAKIIFHT